MNRASDLIAATIKRLRAARGMTVKDLAARCEQLGGVELTANVLTNVEVRRRDVGVEELLILALALDVPPFYLLTPPPDFGDLQVTSTVAVAPEIAGRWIVGRQPLPQSSPGLYEAAAAEHSGSVPATGDAGAVVALQRQAAGLLAQYEDEAQAFITNVRGQVRSLVDGLQQSVREGMSPEEIQQVLASVRSQVPEPTDVDA
ncbi:hypothetical protein GCM10010201_21320 [Pilimelia columellifera subsp. columellifera]|uniref:HTH cro/C1-type domain-containing protein n=2 Tax=Pilimelia TaxID=53370 RepID=A0ABN3NI09_9ACTN